MIALLEFLYNNFIIISVVLFTLVTTLVLTRIFWKEFFFNKKLKFKQNVLRNFNSFRLKKPSLKSIAIIFVLITVPVVFIFAFVRSPIAYDDHIHHLSSKSDVSNIHASYHSKFYSMTLQSVEQEDADAILQEQYETRTIFGDNIDFVTQTSDDNIIVANQTEINIVENDDNTLRILETIVPNLEGTTIQGVFVTSDSLFVIAQPVFNGNIADLETYKPYTLVFQYNMDTYEQDQVYTFSGSAIQIDRQGDYLVIISDHFIPFDSENFDLDNHKPFYVKGSTVFEEDYSNMVYIEGTEPTNYFTTFMLDLSDGIVETKTALTHHDHQAMIGNNAVYISAKSYSFKMASDYMELSNPVEQERVSITKFSFDHRGLNYFRTRMLSGQVLENGLIVDDQLIMLFIDNLEGTSTVFRFNDRLDMFHRVEVGNIDSIKGYHHQDDILLIKTTAYNIRLFDVSLPTELHLYDPPYILDYPQNIFYDNESNLALNLNINEDKIHIVPYDYEDGLLRELESRITRSTYRQIQIGRFYDVRNLQFIASNNTLLLPLIGDDEYDGASIFVTKVLTYQWDAQDRVFEHNNTLSLPYSIHETNPFIYRMISTEDLYYHITPRGMALQLTDEPELHSYVIFD